MLPAGSCTFTHYCPQFYDGAAMLKTDSMQWIAPVLRLDQASRSLLLNALPVSVAHTCALQGRSIPPPMESCAAAWDSTRGRILVATSPPLGVCRAIPHQEC